MLSLKFIISLLIFILGVHVVATVNYWYWTYQWFDIPMHFLGGFWVAAAFLYLNPKSEIQNFKFFQLPDYLISFIAALSFVALIGVFWEFFEFFCDVFISPKGYYFQVGAVDTLADLFFDLFGGAAAFFANLIARDYNNKV